ncbi:MAG: hypothetical protein EA360_11660 [Balneolaceae bacterium]|nr:MAG: hypothetical protein EA360_11660 [Balneolaceae bacterium]
MTLLFLTLLMLLGSDPKPERSTSAVMEVRVHVVSGSLKMGEFDRNVIAGSVNEEYKVGYKEIFISYPAETEVITGTGNASCSCYITTDLEKIDAHTGKMTIHYVLTQNSGEHPNSTPRQSAMIVYL